MHSNDIFDQNKLDTQLHKAAHKNDLKQITNLINKGADVNAKNHRDGNSPLHRVRSPEAVELLITGGANVHAISNSGTPLHRAVKRGNPLVVQALLAHGAYLNAVNKDKKTPLQIAYDHKNEELISLLLQAQSNRDSPAHIAQILVKECLKSQTNPTLILFSLSEESKWLELINNILINQLIRNRKVNYYLSDDSKDELLQAVMNGLISNGADKNGADQNNNSNTPLHTAIEILKDKLCHDHLHVCKYIEYLLKNNPDLELQNASQKTALQLAEEIANNATTTSKELIESREKVRNILATAADNAKLANNNNTSTLYLDLERKLPIEDNKSEEAAPK